MPRSQHARGVRRGLGLGLSLVLGFAQAGWANGAVIAAEAGTEFAAVDAVETRVVSEVAVADLDGRWVRPLGTGASGVRVLVFVSNDCPIANRYAPEIRRIAREYGRRGVGFWVVHPLADETEASIREHTREYGLPGTVVRDPERRLVSLLGIRVTPEVAVVDGDGRLRYRGRIDDRYAALGQKRARATRRDLCEALEAVLAGRDVAEARTRAVGCVLAGETGGRP